MVTRLLEGHAKFRQNYFEGERELFDALARGVHAPAALLITCCDARIVPSLIVSADPGDLFIVRNIANLVPRFGDDQPNRSVGAAIEFAVHKLQVPHAVVLGHTDCRGLHALVEGHERLAGEMPTLAAWLHDAIELRARLAAIWSDHSPEEIASQLVYENVAVQLENLMSFPVVQQALDQERLELHGWVFDVHSGKLQVLDPATSAFSPQG